jgi:hypothetical protein
MLALTYFSVVLEGALALRLISTGLFRSFRLFTAYLIVLFARDVVTLQLAPRNTRMYEGIWAWSGIALLVLQTLVVFELYGRVRSQILDFGAWSKRFFITNCGFAAIVALSTTWVDLSRPLRKSLVQAAYTLAQRNIGMALAIITVLSVVVFYPFRVRLKRNTTIHSYLLAVYLGSNALIFGAMNLELIRRRSAGFAVLATAIFCYGSWIVLLRPANEVIPRQLGPLSLEEREDLVRRESALLDVERLTRDL